jgi:hypothetical protein
VGEKFSRQHMRYEMNSIKLKLAKNKTVDSSVGRAEDCSGFNLKLSFGREFNSLSADFEFGCFLLFIKIIKNYTFVFCYL